MGDYINGLVSVIVPVYNMEPYLERCLVSILENTYKMIELICVNDGSSDRSLSIIKHYAEKDDRIKIIDKANAGLSAARNDGMQCAKGAWISFVDSDDYIHKDFFSVLLS